MTTTERFSKTHPDFQEKIRNLAEDHGHTTETVYAWWLEYCDDCRNYDQSPVFSEFERWYEPQLTRKAVTA